MLIPLLVSLLVAPAVALYRRAPELAQALVTFPVTAMAVWAAWDIVRAIRTGRSEGERFVSDATAFSDMVMTVSTWTFFVPLMLLAGVLIGLVVQGGMAAWGGGDAARGSKAVPRAVAAMVLQAGAAALAIAAVWRPIDAMTAWTALALSATAALVALTSPAETEPAPPPPPPGARLISTDEDAWSAFR